MKNIVPVLFFVVMFTLNFWGKISATIFKSKEDRAISIANQLVLERLRSPSSASFVKNEILYQKEDQGKEYYIIKSTVDAQNGFGAHIRSSYCVAISHQKDEAASLFHYKKDSCMQSCEDSDGRVPASLAIDIMKRLNDFP